MVLLPYQEPQRQQGQGWGGGPQGLLSASSGRGAPSSLSRGRLSKWTKALASSSWGFPLAMCPRCPSTTNTQCRGFLENLPRWERPTRARGGLVGSSEPGLLPA